MGPTCEVLIQTDDGAVLDALDQAAETINRTRKRRVWDVWIRDRPVHVQVTRSPPTVELSAGCNQPEDYDILRELSLQIAAKFGGIASEPEK